jgi:hypothetical protein
MRHYTAGAVNDVHQGDLIVMPRTPKGHKYIYAEVDIYSRLLAAVPLKSRLSTTTAEAVRKLHKWGTPKFKPKSLRTDQGSEFFGAFKKYCDDNGIRLTFGIPGNHNDTAVIDAAIKQLERLLFRWMDVTGRKDWNTVLDDFVVNRNNAFNRIIKATPIAVYTGEVAPAWKYPKPDKESMREKFKLGDYVRIKTRESRLRATDWTFSGDIYKIVEVVSGPGKPTYYTVKNIRNGEIDPRMFYNNDLQLVSPEAAKKETSNIYEVEKIDGHRIRNGRLEYLIKWAGYRERTWEPVENLRLDDPNTISEAEKIYLKSLKSVESKALSAYLTP